MIVAAVTGCAPSNDGPLLARWIPRREHFHKITTRSMALHTKTSDRAATEFHKTLSALNVTQHRAGQWFGVNSRSIRRWEHGDRRVPRGVAIVIHLLSAGVITAVQVEEAAAGPVPPAQTNGGGKRELPALPEPTPAPAVIDRDRTLAEKVLALTGCRWPHNDPRRPDFFFCDAAITEPPYCARHTRLAHTAQPLPKAHPGFRPSASLAGSLAPAGAHECPSRSLKVCRS